MDKDFEDVSQQLTQDLHRMGDERRARILIDLYFNLEEPEEWISRAFFEWLDAPFGQEQKYAHLERIFNEMLDNNTDVVEDSPSELLKHTNDKL